VHRKKLCPSLFFFNYPGIPCKLVGIVTLSWGIYFPLKQAKYRVCYEKIGGKVFSG